MTRTQKVFRFIAISAALVAFVLATLSLTLTGGIVILVQAEDRHLAEPLIFWAARIGTLGLALAIALAAVDPKWAFRFLWLSALAVTPLFTMHLFPNLWCAFVDCGPDLKAFTWRPVVLVYFAALATAVGGFYLSKPQ